MKRDLKLEWVHPYTAEHVWHCLTTPELIEKWLMPNNFELKLGHRFQFRSKPMPGWSGIVECEVLEIVPNRKLSYSWVSGDKPGSRQIDTVVTWTLQPEGNNTRLLLEHTGFKGFKAWMVSYMMGSGWKSQIAKNFADLLSKNT
ncbi:SRPBCC family protein [Flavobacterium sp.]|uniref:SRPBCC family protein n=1 Tax=Flavobacterium sp. TaxID=239 RepID=UPI0039E4BE60